MTSYISYSYNTSPGGAISIRQLEVYMFMWCILLEILRISKVVLACPALAASCVIRCARCFTPRGDDDELIRYQVRQDLACVPCAHCVMCTAASVATATCCCRRRIARAPTALSCAPIIGNLNHNGTLCPSPRCGLLCDTCRRCERRRGTRPAAACKCAHRTCAQAASGLMPLCQHKISEQAGYKGT